MNGGGTSYDGEGASSKYVVEGGSCGASRTPQPRADTHHSARIRHRMVDPWRARRGGPAHAIGGSVGNDSDITRQREAKKVPPVATRKANHLGSGPMRSAQVAGTPARTRATQDSNCPGIPGGSMRNRVVCGVARGTSERGVSAGDRIRGKRGDRRRDSANGPLNEAAPESPLWAHRLLRGDCLAGAALRNSGGW
jgi:hypothetical protein